MKIQFLIAILFFLFISCGYFAVDQKMSGSLDAIQFQQEPGAIRYPLIDSHVHYFDFLQETDGFPALLKAMDSAGVLKCLIMGMPLIKKWDVHDKAKPRYYLANDSRTYWYSATDYMLAESIQKLPKSDQNKFLPFITGIYPADKNAVHHIKRLLEYYPDFWAGIGEIITRHGQLSALTYGETPRVDHLALDSVYRLAAQRDLPVLIHHNIGSAWLKDTIYRDELERALRKHRKTRFIWAHGGMGYQIQIPHYEEVIRQLLRNNSNLWIDISWVLYDHYIFHEGRVDPAWIQLVKDYPKRFILGTDQTARFNRDYQEKVFRFYAFLDQFPPKIVADLTQDNFRRLLPKRIFTSSHADE